ncbi:hypothetical protein B0H15DRAFT_798621 [Mycena belliarum]|uniref:Uncharacterized protein n=1 Tax=Mycena belliarum TaxID=1033014 RepID=A0AAD6UCK9_9AGAR|nr:hypothetical protein B0H15DRAFT_798621 [Mycena belliae]
MANSFTLLLPALASRQRYTRYRKFIQSAGAGSLLISQVWSMYHVRKKISAVFESSPAEHPPEVAGDKREKWFPPTAWDLIGRFADIIELRPCHNGKSWHCHYYATMGVMADCPGVRRTTGLLEGFPPRIHYSHSLQPYHST